MSDIDDLRRIAIELTSSAVGLQSMQEIVTNWTNQGVEIGNSLQQLSQELAKMLSRAEALLNRLERETET